MYIMYIFITEAREELAVSRLFTIYKTIIKWSVRWSTSLPRVLTKFSGKHRTQTTVRATEERRNRACHVPIVMIAEYDGGEQFLIERLEVPNRGGYVRTDGRRRGEATLGVLIRDLGKVTVRA